MADTTDPATPEPGAAQFDVTGLVDQLEAVADAYHKLFDGHLPDPGRATQFDAFMSTVKMAVSHSGDEATKGA